MAINLTRVSDEDNEEIFYIIQGLLENLSGGFQDMELWKQAVELQRACLAAVASGSDNKELVFKMQKASGELDF
jgi:hypothetical protein